ncbi:UDP-glucose 4-epimerase GalE [Ensifer sp. MJa1]|uniref:UDP-glucose 4-epimerase GalE n=1 Tax=Ensifer sp. MJa1 TaxID=2919888 RepID=UPI00300A3225
MSILVTGGAGYIGSHMVWELLDAGHEVVVLDRLSTGFQWALAPGAKFYRGDIGDRHVLDEIILTHRISAIIHFAGSVIVPESVSDPLSYYDNNTAKSRTLIAAAVEGGVKHFVFSSTAAVYGTHEDMKPVRETARLKPESPYGTSKLMTEMMLKDAAVAHDFNYTVLRYFNVAGADPSLRTGQSTRGATHLIKVACEAALGKRPGIDVFGVDYPTLDGTCIRDYIHVSDLAAVHLLALERMQSGGKSIVANCGYGHGFSVLEVLNRVKSITGNDFPVRFAPRRSGDAVSVVADSTIAHSEFNWIPKYDDLSLILKTALSWEEQLSSREVDLSVS